MPSPWRTAQCLICDSPFRTRSKATATCSPHCRALFREQRKLVHGTRRGKAPRKYPPDIIQKVRDLYVAGLTRAEVQEQVGPGFKVETIMKRHGIEARRAGAREFRYRGSSSRSWKGDKASYGAFHLRVESSRGKPQLCGECGVSGPGHKYEWANLTGSYEDINDYMRMCVGCHRKFDAKRRRETGRPTCSIPKKGRRDI